VIFPSPRVTSLLLLSLCGLAASAQDAFLPLPQAGPEMMVVPESESRFLKPTKSIKPPTTSASTAGQATPQVTAPIVARLRRLILMPAGLPAEALREQIAASGQGRQPVTVVGMQAPAPVLTKLADLFGSKVTEETEKKVIDAVRVGMSAGSPGSSPRRVEVVGWSPVEGVMAVTVYPES
jgi:hypothetical protein